MLIPLLARFASPASFHEDVGRRWDEALRRLREDWLRDPRPKPGDLPAYAEGFPQEVRGEVYEDLVADHLRLSWEAGERRRLEEYPGIVPGADLVEDEFLARCQLPYGDLPSPEEYARRFPALPEAADRLRRRMLGSGRYVVISRLAWGATGEVWDAVDRRARCRVALKRARPGIPGPAEFRRRLEREARLAVRLTHPGIMGFHDYFPGNRYEEPFLAMPRFERRTMADVLGLCHGSQTDPDLRRELWSGLLRAFVDLCDAVGYAHREGVFHRDLKPGNVLVGREGQVVVVDWGLAAEAGTPAGTELVGTPEYMAPEQLEGAFGPPSDIFALGAILHEILTGAHPRPWEAAYRPADWIKRVRRGERRKAAPKGGRLGRDLMALCRWAMDGDPGRRPGTAEELGRRVEERLSRASAAVRFWRRLRILGL